MKQPLPKLFALVSLASLVVLAGCMQNEPGWSTAYLPDHRDKISVVMPSGAPSISQQYFIDPAGAAHRGIDVIDRIGTPVIAPEGGQVTEVYFEPMYGNRIVIDHGTDSAGAHIITVYKHLKNQMVKPGDRVERGQKIATLGNTGALAGGIPHLHYEVHREVKPGILRSQDPHLFWYNGVGQVTCFDPAGDYDNSRFTATYPVPCR